eukprot:PhF_6_TR26198/c0_g1_i1/m.37305
MFARIQDEFIRRDYEGVISSVNLLLTFDEYSPKPSEAPTPAELRRALIIRCDSYTFLGRHDDALKDANSLIKKHGTADLACHWRLLRGMYYTTYSPELEATAKLVADACVQQRNGKTHAEFVAMGFETLKSFLANRGVDVHNACDVDDLAEKALHVQTVDGVQLDTSLKDDIEEAEKLLKKVNIAIAIMNGKMVDVADVIGGCYWLLARLKSSHMRVVVMAIRNVTDVVMTFNKKASGSVFQEGRFKQGFEPPESIPPGKAAVIVAQNRNFCVTGVAGTLMFDAPLPFTSAMTLTPKGPNSTSSPPTTLAMHFCNPLRGTYRTGISYSSNPKRVPNVENPQSGYRVVLVTPPGGGSKDTRPNSSSSTGGGGGNNTPQQPSLTSSGSFSVSTPQTYRASSWGGQVQVFNLAKHSVARFSDDTWCMLFNMLPPSLLRKCTAVSKSWRKMLLTAHPERFFSYYEYTPPFPDYSCAMDFVSCNWTAQRDRKLLVEVERSTYVGCTEYVVSDATRRERLFACRQSRSSPSQDFTFYYRNWNYPILRAAEQTLTMASAYDLLVYPSMRCIGSFGKKSFSSSQVDDNSSQPIKLNGTNMYVVAGNRILHAEGSPALAKLQSGNTSTQSPLPSPAFTKSHILAAATEISTPNHTIAIDVMKGTDMLHIVVIAMLQAFYLREGS